MTAFNRLRGVLPALTLPALTLPALTLIGALGTASVAQAQSASSSASAGATTGLGTHHRFTSVAAAQQHCPGDTIVWSNGVNLTYHVVSGGSGMASHGFYACKMEADSAGFHPVD